VNTENVVTPAPPFFQQQAVAIGALVNITESCDVVEGIACQSIQPCCGTRFRHMPDSRSAGREPHTLSLSQVNPMPLQRA
jgi:hypothetical protein